MTQSQTLEDCPRDFMRLCGGHLHTDHNNEAIYPFACRFIHGLSSNLSSHHAISWLKPWWLICPETHTHYPQLRSSPESQCYRVLGFCLFGGHSCKEVGSDKWEIIIFVKNSLSLKKNWRMSPSPSLLFLQSACSCHSFLLASLHSKECKKDLSSTLQGDLCHNKRL